MNRCFCLLSLKGRGPTGWQSRYPREESFGYRSDVFCGLTNIPKIKLRATGDGGIAKNGTGLTITV